MEKQIPMTAAQLANPSGEIDYCLAPYKLAKQPTKSQPFLQFLEQLIYQDTSAESHLKPGGLFAVGSIVLADIALEDIRQKIENRTIHQYKFRHYCRTVLTVLGIVSEIELYCKLNNREQLVRVWTTLAGRNADTKDVYQVRYQGAADLRISGVKLRGNASRCSAKAKCNVPNGLSIRLSGSRVWSPTNWTTSQQKTQNLHHGTAYSSSQKGQSHQFCLRSMAKSSTHACSSCMKLVRLRKKNFEEHQTWAMVSMANY